MTKVLIEGRKVRAVAREFRVSRNTVRKYLGVSEPVCPDPATAEKQMPLFVPAELESLVESKKIVRAITAELGVIHEAREQNADMIVIGTHGRTGLSHVLLGSVAERVVRLADRPVLTVRAPADAIKEPS